MKKILKHTFKLTSFYTLGDILVKGIRFLLLPIYTIFISPSEYGILALALVISNISTAVLSLGLNGAAFKFYYDLDAKQRKRFYGTLWLFFILFPGIILILIELTGQGLCGRLLTKVPYAPYLRIALWTSFLTIAFTNYCRELLKASERAIAYVLINVGQSILMIGFSVWLVVFMKKGAEGALLAQLYGVCGMSVVSVFIIGKYASFSVDFSFLKKALIFGFPLMPHFLAHWVLGASDKVILERYVPLSDVGIYSVGYLLGSMMLLFATACNNALLPIFGRAKPCGNDEAKMLSQITTYYILALTIVGLSLSLFSREIVLLFTAPSYEGAIKIVPWIVLGSFFMGLYCIPMNVLVQIVGKNWSISFFTITAAVINIVLNNLLIPKIGMIAAAFTTALSYFIMFVGIFLLAMKKIPLPYEYHRISKIFISAIIIYLIGRYLSLNSLWISIILKSLLLTSFPFLLWLINFFNKKECESLIRIPQIITIYGLFRKHQIDC